MNSHTFAHTHIFHTTYEPSGAPGGNSARHCVLHDLVENAGVGAGTSTDQRATQEGEGVQRALIKEK